MPTRGLPRHRAVTAPAVAVGAALALACVPLTASPALAAPAPAASLVHDRGELWFKAAPGQENRLTVSAKIVERTEWEADYVLTFNDRYAITLAAKECTYPQPADRTVAK
ncbi:hypothetical protein ACH3XX_19295 [Streptomyces scabiei]|uniref:hypothetical protein n=1 Tax=Streptomyces scabiei TaxID=1930 RepID=UPI000B07D3DD|nr:hypothetical protein [Streptomyces scabiei]MDX2832877.1 hypothetical protein [Streptomyces scabiei]MDX3676201.1 hypothetical protein [Streptomyces scabiei]